MGIKVVANKPTRKTKTKQNKKEKNIEINKYLHKVSLNHLLTNKKNLKE